MPTHTVIFEPPNRSLTADEAAAIYGMSAEQLVRAILCNEGGRFDRLYRRTAEKTIRKGSTKDEPHKPSNEGTKREAGGGAGRCL